MEYYEQIICTEASNLIYLGDEAFVLENSNIISQVLNATTDLNSDDDKLKSFLKSIDMECLFDVLKAANITYRCLQFLKKEDLKEAVPHLGLRVEFREKLFAWKKAGLGIEDETMSIPSKVEQWLNKNCSNAMSPSCSTSGKVINKDLKCLMSESSAILKYANENHQLRCEQRDEIINIIIEDVINNKTVLYAHDFVRLTEEICSVFPCENNMKDYYYIPIKAKNNAIGKLYFKYKNKCLKRKILIDPIENFSHSTSKVADNETIEFDEGISNALKTSLSRDSADWNEVCDKWKKTYLLRQKDVKNLTSFEFLQAWPKLSDCRAHELINIDFNIMHPNKGHLLLSKWEMFKTKIRRFYDSNIHNEFLKQLLSKITLSTNIDSQDYIYTILLSAFDYEK